MDCEWSDFSPWSACSRSCGGGFQARERRILMLARRGGRRCQGQTRETRFCNRQRCPRKDWKKEKHRNSHHYIHHTCTALSNQNTPFRAKFPKKPPFLFFYLTFFGFLTHRLTSQLIFKYILLHVNSFCYVPWFL